MKSMPVAHTGCQLNPIFMALSTRRTVCHEEYADRRTLPISNLYVQGNAVFGSEGT